MWVNKRKFVWNSFEKCFKKKKRKGKDSAVVTSPMMVAALQQPRRPPLQDCKTVLWPLRWPPAHTSCHLKKKKSTFLYETSNIHT
jgi:hypothetical protein